jgi:hypothetical protein
MALVFPILIDQPSGSEVFQGMADLDSQMHECLLERFGRFWASGNKIRLQCHKCKTITRRQGIPLAGRGGRTLSKVTQM